MNIEFSPLIWCHFLFVFLSRSPSHITPLGGGWSHSRLHPPPINILYVILWVYKLSVVCKADWVVADSTINLLLVWIPYLRSWSLVKLFCDRNPTHVYLESNKRERERERESLSFRWLLDWSSSSSTFHQAWHVKHQTSNVVENCLSFLATRALLKISLVW